MTFKDLQRSTKVILTLQAVGMLMGASTHIMWVYTNGFLSENYNAPLFTTVFWDSLTFLDPIAAFLLFFRPKLGVYLTFAIIVFDIIHNNIFYREELYVNPPALGEWLETYWMILGQLVFGAFVILTFQRNLRELRN